MFFKLHLVDTDPHGVFGREGLHLGQCFRFDFLSADGDHLVYGAVTDDFTHDRFGNIAEGFTRFSNLEKEFNRVRNAVLNHPFHQCGVQVASDHLRFSPGLPLSTARNSGRDRWHLGS